MKTACYCRVSTEEQARRGLSITDQKDALQQWCIDNGHSIVDIYIDAGVSGHIPTSRRKEFCRMMEDVKRGKIDLIIFIKLDRWFRNVGEYYKTKEVLDKYGVNWKAIWEQYDTETANGKFMINTMLNVAEDWSNRTSERIKQTNEAKRQRGELVGRVPIGFTKVDKRLAIDPETADIAREIFSYYIQTQSINALRRHMLEKHNYLLSYNQYRRILSNRKYIGIAQDIQMCEPLISPSDFETVQRILADRSTRNSGIVTEPHIYLFNSLVFCAECGTKMHTHDTKKHDKKYCYYRCPEYQIRRCSHKHRVREDDIESAAIKQLLTAVNDYNLKAMKEQRRRQTTDTAVLKRKMEKLKDLYLSDLIDKEIYQKDYLQLKKKLEDAEIAKADVQVINVTEIENAIRMYDKLDRTGKREFWRRTVNRIEVDNEGNVFLGVGWL